MPTEISRRNWLKDTVRLVGVAATTVIVAQRAQAQSATPTKQSKAEALYQDSPNGAQTCGACAYYLPPIDCKLVQGPVHPTGWCRNFSPKT